MVTSFLSSLCKSHILFCDENPLWDLPFSDLIITDYAICRLLRLCVVLISFIVFECGVIYCDEILIFGGVREMGNENSSLPSDNTTPTSDWQSVCSYGSRRRSSVGSMRMPSPVDAPEPDLSHLTAEEISQIREVIYRAKEVQQEEHQRIRKLEEEYTSFTAGIEQKAQSSEPETKQKPLCPICLERELLIEGDSVREGQNICADCQTLVCSECGSFQASYSTRLQEWVCTVCQSRRRFVLGTGLWYPGTEPEADVPLAKEIESRISALELKMIAQLICNWESLFPIVTAREANRTRPPLERTASADDIGDEPIQPRKRAVIKRQISLPNYVNEHEVAKALDAIKEAEQSLEGSQESLSLKESPQPEEKQNSASASVIGAGSASMLRGMGQISRSDSDYSDMASDVDMEDVSMMNMYRGEGTSPDEASDDYSLMSIGSSDDSGKLRRKHRPKSLNLSRSFSATSSEDEATDSTISTDTESRLAPLAKMDEARVAMAASAFAEDMEEIKGAQLPENGLEYQLDKLEYEQPEEIRARYSPTGPISPSWREGLDSPPFSPRRRDSYPGKRRGSPVSPKDKRLQFNYVDISPPSRQLSMDELYDERHGNHPGSDENYAPVLQSFAQKPSPMSPEELNSLVTTTGESMFFDKPKDKKNNKAFTSYDKSDHGRNYSEPPTVIDLATYAATIASNTASLTSMSVSPTTLQVYPLQEHDTISPESQDSTDSTSPVSPGYYDNAPLPGEAEDVELADPSTKSIDYQGTKRQKARPPTTDWSPIIDLSPILDVSPSIEEAEQEEMLAQQKEEMRRRESQEEDENEETTSDKSDIQEKQNVPTGEDDDDYCYYSLKRYDRVEDITKLNNIEALINASSPGANAVPVNKTECNHVCANADTVIPDSILACTSLPASTITSTTIITQSAKFSSLTSTSAMDTVSAILPNIAKFIKGKDIPEPVQKPTPEIKQKPIKLPTVRVRRKLPEPTAEMIATHVQRKSSQKAPPLPPPRPPIRTSLSTAKTSNSQNSESPNKSPTVSHTSPVKEKMSVFELLKQNSTERPVLQRQDSDEKKKRAKDLKAKPNPIVVKHIESEEITISPQYKVLDSPPSPESRGSLKRDYSDSTSVSPSSSPDRDAYMYPSPVTPPDSDSSPPKPHSPSSPGTDFEEDHSQTLANEPVNASNSRNNEKIEQQLSAKKTEVEEIFDLTSVHDKIKAFEQAAKPKESRKLPSEHTKDYRKNVSEQKDSRKVTSEQRKVRRKLPPIPAEEKEKTNRIKGHGHGHAHARKYESKIDNRTRTNLPSSTSQSDESMNEDDKEVARIIKRQMNDLDKPSEDRLNGNILSSTDSGGKSSSDERRTDDVIPVNIPPDIKPCMRRSAAALNMDQILKNEWDETDMIIDSLINIYGAPITRAMKSLKRKLQEELRRVTENRRRKIEELEEIRALQLQIGELKLGACSLSLSPRPIPPPRQTKSAVSQQSQNGKKRGSPYSTPPPRASPQILPRRSRHKRQSSDPMISKFSPIKEDKDIEADFQIRLNESADTRQIKYPTDDSSQSGLSDSESSRSEPVINATYKKIKPIAYAKIIFTGNQQAADKIVSNKLQPQTRLKSQSESQLLEEKSIEKSTRLYPDSDDKRAKEEKKQQLLFEIEKRKKKLEETARLQTEIIKLARAKQALAHSYDDIPKRSSHVSYTPPRPIPTGIIKPIDDEDDKTIPYDIPHYNEYEPAKKPADVYQSQDSYSSSEYLAHKQETARRQRYDDMSYSSPYLYSNEPNEASAFVPTTSKSKPDVRSYSTTNVIKDCMSSSMTLPELHSNRSDLDFIPTRDNYVAFSDTEASPASDYTPAMPLLDDVTARSRKIIHDIGSGSRPVSAEFNFPEGVEDLMNAMYRVESDNSVDADEPIMKHMTEGGVTILKQLERKKQPIPIQPRKYNFSIKRILLTRDPKDRSVKGNGIGMKIIGGKRMPGGQDVGAYVATIYPGGVADQLHGELQEGDQILEWNGIELVGKSYEEVFQIISQPNGEIELVVRPGANITNKQVAAPSQGQAGSCHSSYDNLETLSDEEYEHCMRTQHGVDPKQLAAQLEGIREAQSPDASPSSSQQEFLTPSMSSPCSTPHSDPTSTSSDKQRRVPEKQTIIEEKNMGEIQLQLSHDDFDNTLNVHVIQARTLLAKDINGLSDPFVKLYLLPGRTVDNKRRTKHIPRTLNPEWHQTVMFQNVHREELKYKTLEITVWDYDRFKANDFLGEIVLDMAEEDFMDNRPHWYPLNEHDETTGVELPRPTVLPPRAESNDSGPLMFSPRPRPRRDKSTSTSVRDSSTREERRRHGMGRRRRSLGTLVDVDSLETNQQQDISSARSSPILLYKPCDTSHSSMTEHAFD